MLRIGDDHTWARALVADLPRPWGARLLSAWEKRRSSFNAAKVTAEGNAALFLHRYVTDDRDVDQAHEHQPHLGEGDGAGEPDERREVCASAAILGL